MMAMAKAMKGGKDKGPNPANDDTSSSSGSGVETAPARPDHLHDDEDAAAAAAASAVAAAAAEVELLRKQLGDATAGKTQMEMEYMNILSTLEKDQRVAMEGLERRIRELEEERKTYDLKVDAAEARTAQAETKLETLRETMSKEAEAQSALLEKQSEVISNYDCKIDAKDEQISVMKGALAKAEQLKEALHEEITELKGKLETKSNVIGDLRKEIEAVRAEGEKAEKVAVEDMEKKASKVSASHETQVNSIQKELTRTNMEKAELERDFQAQMRALEEEQDEVRQSYEQELEENAATIALLERDLDELKEKVQKMKNEKEQLAGSMTELSACRRDEIEELQEELLDKTARTTAQDREIQSLKMEMADRDQRHNIEITSLKKHMETLRTEMAKGGAMNSDGGDGVGRSVHELIHENEELRTRQSVLSEECRSLREKVAVMTDRGSSQSLKAMKSRNEKLQKEVETLTRRLKRLEKYVTRVAV